MEYNVVFYNPYQDFRDQLVRNDPPYNTAFACLWIGGEMVSIQASSIAYSEPRADELEPWRYSAFEVMWPGKDEPEAWVPADELQKRLLDFYAAKQPHTPTNYFDP